MDTSQSIPASDLDAFRRPIRLITRRLMRLQPGGCDKLAHDREDYESILTVKAWSALSWWKSDPQRRSRGESAAKRYVCKCLWNEARVYERLRRSQRLSATVVPIYEHDQQDADFEARMLLRHDLTTQLKQLKPKHREALISYAADGRVGGPNDRSIPIQEYRSKWRYCTRARAQIRSQISLGEIEADCISTI